MNRSGTPLCMAALVWPSDAGMGTRRVMLRYVKRILREFLALEPTVWLPPSAPQGAELQTFLGGLRGDARLDVLRIVARPHVHVLLRCALRAREAGDGAEAGEVLEQFALQLLYEMTLSSRFIGEVRWTLSRSVALLFSPTHGDLMRNISSGATLGFQLGDGPVGVTHEGVVIASAPGGEFQRVGEQTFLCLVDNNPLVDVELHPMKSGNRLSLGDAPSESWVSALSTAFDAVEAFAPELHSEMTLLLRQIMPVGTDEERHLSASYSEAVGMAYMSLHPRANTMLEALVHEYQHSKLNMLCYVETLLHNAFTPLYHSPVRPDPRPLHGVLLAAHAFVAVAEVYDRMLQAPEVLDSAGDVSARFKEIVCINAEALEVLEAHGQWTVAGQELLGGMLEIQRRHRARAL